MIGVLIASGGVRGNIADFVSALIWVYTLIIFAWIIVSWVFSFGVRIPYSRPVTAVLDFLRDVTNPYLRLFRRLPLQFGPIDFSPMVAIFVLIFGGRILVNLLTPSP
jgi:YggT family protein